MENKMDFNNLEFNMYYLPVTNFKQKNYLVLINVISQSRLYEYMEFVGPAHMYFDELDNKHAFPKIIGYDSYNRNKTNCLIYKLPYNEKNDELYDYLFIYYSEMGKEPYYGYLAYNEKTGKCSHKFLISGDMNDLLKSLNEFFNNLFRLDIYYYYLKRFNSTHDKFGLGGYGPTIVDYNNMIKHQEEKINKYSKNKFKK